LEEDVDVSKVDAFLEPLESFQALEANTKFIHLSLCGGQDSLSHYTILLQEEESLLFRLPKNSNFFENSSSNKLKNTWRNLKSYYSQVPKKYHSECSLATSECLDLYLLEKDKKMVFKYVSSDLGYNPLNDEDKKRISVAIEFMQELEKLEKLPTNH
jgi:hypothetical protein